MEIVATAFYILLPFMFLAVAFAIGSSIERAHFRRLEAAERELAGVMISDMKRLPANWRPSQPVLVAGEAVIATDRFKVFTAAIRNLFGGRVRGYETLVERARREAIVRMLRQAQQLQANVVWNVRIETTTIQGKQANQAGGIEVLAYGTAMHVTG